MKHLFVPVDFDTHPRFGEELEEEVALFVCACGCMRARDVVS